MASWFLPRLLRAHSLGSSSAARRGAVACIHRFGSTLNAHLHFHCVVIDGVIDAAPTGGVIFTAATGLEANAIAQVQVRRRSLRTFVRRGVLPGADAREMAQWQHGGGCSVDASVESPIRQARRLPHFVSHHKRRPAYHCPMRTALISVNCGPDYPIAAKFGGAANFGAILVERSLMGVPGLWRVA